MKELGVTLANLRKEKGLGQKEVADIMNLSVGTISNYENGIHSPGFHTLCRLADFFQVTTDYLLGRTGYRYLPEALEEHFTPESSIHDVVGILLSLDPEKRRLLLSYLDFLKDSRQK